jgi:micrococcal nuclease
MKIVWGVMFWCLSALAHSEAFVSKVVTVFDGDTVLIKRSTGLVKVRLVEIDAPERSQPFGASSRQSLIDMVLGKSVTFTSQAFDRYGRMVARLDVNGLDVNAEQIRRGMAWEYSHFHSDYALIALEAEARAVPRGLWAMSNPTPPWDWRKVHPSNLPIQTAPVSTINPNCGEKNSCAKMESCEEARHYLSVCGLKYLDGDGDGMPCEKLCARASKKEKQ